MRIRQLQERSGSNGQLLQDRLPTLWLSDLLWHRSGRFVGEIVHIPPYRGFWRSGTEIVRNHPAAVIAGSMRDPEGGMAASLRTPRSTWRSQATGLGRILWTTSDRQQRQIFIYRRPRGQPSANGALSAIEALREAFVGELCRVMLHGGPRVETQSQPEGHGGCEAYG